MFGYITANLNVMSSEQQSRYRAWYCGLCKALSRQHGGRSRFTLNYDMTFLVMLLSSVYDYPPESGSERCAAHPIKRHDYLINDISLYAADMNVLLVYHNLRDDWQDDRSLKALAASGLFRKAARRATEAYSRQSQAVLEGLESLAACEASGETNPDIPAEAFGGIMAELFAMRDDEHADDLRRFGRALGRFIYIMDACADFDSDLRHTRYNPLVTMTRSDFMPMLTMLAAECTQAFDRLPVTTDREIMENILYSGMWSGFPTDKPQDKKKTRKKKEVLSEQ